MSEYSIPAQFLVDCHYLGGLPSSELLLQRNAALPWFIVLPRTTMQDILDLPQAALHQVLVDCAAVSQFLKQELDYGKVNFAGLGNVVPDMHLHIVGRREGDACWPKPVWGNLPDGGEYTSAQIADWQSKLHDTISLQLLDS